MHQKSPKEQPTVLRITTGDPYYDFGGYMPADRVREAEADWLKWREDAKLAMRGIDSKLAAAESAVPVELKADQHGPATRSTSTGPNLQAPAQELEPMQILVQVQRDAIDVAKAHLAIAIEGQEQAENQAKGNQTRADAAQRQARISNYIAAGSFLVGVLGVLYGFLK